MTTDHHGLAQLFLGCQFLVEGCSSSSELELGRPRRLEHLTQTWSFMCMCAFSLFPAPIPLRSLLVLLSLQGIQLIAFEALRLLQERR